jgi:penicillin amidase
LAAGGAPDGVSAGAEFTRRILLDPARGAAWCGAPGCGPLLSQALTAALAKLSDTFGSDPATWRWGALHVADFKPALPIPGRDAERRVGPLPIGGSGSTPMAMGPAADFHVASGASVRLVMDVGAWDNSVAINTPGQSGDPASPHYRDLFARWATGNYVPFAWSRPRVLQEAERIITVTP